MNDNIYIYKESCKPSTILFISGCRDLTTNQYILVYTGQRIWLTCPQPLTLWIMNCFFLICLYAMDSVDQFSSGLPLTLTNRTRAQFMDINGTFWKICHLGVKVPQGSVLGLLLYLYLLYISPVVDIICRHNLNFHIYVDDSQLFLSFKGADRLFDSKLQLEAWINNILQWMVFNELKLNQDKTELLIINSRYCFCPSLSCLHVGDINADPVKASSNLGVVFGDTMSFKSHIADVCKSSFYHLRNISRIFIRKISRAFESLYGG